MSDKSTNTATARQGDPSSAGDTGHAAMDGASSSSQKERRLIQHGHSSLVRGAGPSLPIKRGSLFLLSSHDGDIDTDIHPAYGLYFHDTRFLSRHKMRINGTQFSVLLSTDQDGVDSTVELTNPEIPLGDDKVIPKEGIGVRRGRAVTDCIEEKVGITNFEGEPFDLQLDMEFDADFENMFVVRGADEGKRGKMHDPAWKGDSLIFAYDGADGRQRTTTITFDPPPQQHDGRRVYYQVTLEPHKPWDLSIAMQVEDKGAGNLETAPQQPHDLPFTKVEVHTSNALFDAAIARAFTDLRMLVSREHGDTYVAAGVPWYVALFGRDSIITALETIAFDPSIAANTLRVLAEKQGTTHDQWRDEEPGKILHELRVGEKAHLNEVPQTPYYGTVDATPLFLILLGEYIAWTGDMGIWKELKGNVEGCLKWKDESSDHDGDGFADYEPTSSKGLSNQGWKDSGNSITNRDGSLVTPPVALVEVQGYIYRAKLAIANLYQQDGDADRANQLRQQAADLRSHFNQAYWVADRNYLAVAIQKDGKQAQSLTSNPGQALWGGIVDEKPARAVAKMLMDDCMFNGWGIRTMAQGEAAYNPIDYQVGSVWPHDNAMIASGLRRYHFDQEFLRVFTGIFHAATRFQHYRLPEVFAGFRESDYNTPVHYPVACSPQAWAAGAIPYLFTTALGLVPDAAANRLHVQRPLLPSWLEYADVTGLKVADSTFHLRYQRVDDDTLVAVVDRQGDAQLSIDY